MNPNELFDSLPADEREEIARLMKTADGLRPDERFLQKTEMQLRNVFVEKREKRMKRYHLIMQFLAGTAAIVALALGTIWLVRSVAPEPHNPTVPGNSPTATAPESNPLPETVPTPTIPAEVPTYDWHGITVYRAADFPETPAEAGIYTYSADPAATIESARKLAERFGIQGDVYLAPTFAARANSFLVTDGKQRLYVTSEHSFSYQSGSGTLFQGSPVSLETVSGPVDSFLKAHGFDFPYRLEPMGGGLSDWFRVASLAQDGRPTSFSGPQEGFQVQVDDRGQVISLDAYTLNVDSQPLGQFGIISAEEAWQKFLQDTPMGDVQRTSSGSGAGRLYWQRAYPDNQAMSLYGNVTSFSCAETGKPPFISINDHAAIGNTSGMEKLAANTFVQAEGQFISENGIQKFQVDSWQTSETYPQSLTGDLRSEEGKIVFSSQGTDYILSDLPAEVPVPVTNIDVSGMVNGTDFFWQSISYFKDGMKGGGGGGGGAFARLNLSRTPVVWPTPEPVATPDSLVGKRFESQQGFLNVLIHQKADGSQRVEYKFAGPDGYFYTLQGLGLEQLQAYHNRPLLVWGTVTENKPSQAPVLTVERYEIPFPDLKFQFVRGTQKLVTLDGQEVVLFTTEDGKSYAQVTPDGSTPTNSLVGKAGDLVFSEVLLVPDETFGGYPAMRIFGGGLVDNPKNGQPQPPEEITADKPLLLPDTARPDGMPPTLTIESIELVNYTDDPRYADSDPQVVSPYIQPAWRLYGHYSDGAELEVLIQALKRDYLLPEPVPALPGG